MTVQNHNSEIPENYQDLLESTALAHVATIGPDGEPQNDPVWFGWGDERVVVFVKPRHTTQMGA